MDNIVDYNRVVLRDDRHNSAESKDKILFDVENLNHKISNIDSIWTNRKEHRDQNMEEFDMNDIHVLVDKDVNRKECVMEIVVDIVDLNDLDCHNDLDMNSKMTTANKYIDLNKSNVRWNGNELKSLR